MEGLESLIAVTSLFSNMAERTPFLRLPQCLSNKESTCNARNPGSSIPGSGRCPGEGNGYPLQYSCLENSMDRGAYWATVHGVTESEMTG